MKKPQIAAILKSPKGLLFIIIILICLGSASKRGEGGTQANEPATTLVIILNEEALSREETILVGEVAHLEGNDQALIEQVAQVSLGQSPRPGQTKTILLQQVLSRLEQQNIPAEAYALSGAERCVVERASRLITPKEIEELVVEEFNQKFSGQGFELNSITCQLHHDLKLPDEEVSFEVLFPSTFSRSEETFRLHLLQGGRLIKQVLMIAKLHYQVQVLVTTRAMQKGESVTKDDLLLQQRIMTSREEKFLTEPSQAIGLICKKSISAGTTISFDLLDNPLLIKKGAIIRIMAESDHLHLESLGKALANGHRGETIPVQNLSSQKQIYGEVVSENQIHINF